MEMVKGTHAEAKVFTDDMDSYARAQIQMICDDLVSVGSRIRVMPDVHPGKVGTIGLTMTIRARVIPHLLGIDIGCGMTCAVLKGKRMEFQKLYCHEHINRSKAGLSLGTLGGGNHFIEVDQDEEGTFYLIIHSGNRHLGKEVTDYYVDRGARLLKESGLEVSYPMTWLEEQLMEEYIADVRTVQAYAQLNREIILAEIIKGMKLKETDRFSSVHNYMDILSGERILRKGAISARLHERVIIPVNVRDGVLLGLGKGNPDWNESAPHGSGRIMKREDIKNHYTVSAFKNEMKGIYSSCIGADTLDGAPFAYRPMEQILEAVRDTVTVTHVLRPVYNFKAGGTG